MEINKLIESLNENERKILPYIIENEISEICKKSKLDKVSVTRALEYLQNKKILNISYKKEKIIEIGVNGALYKKRGLPERRLLNILNEKRILKIEDAQKISSLSDDEFKASLGALKRKAMIEIKNGKIILSANKEEISKKSLEEVFIESLPINYDNLAPEKLHALNTLKSRKNIIEIVEKKTINIEITELGKKIINSKIQGKELIEQLTPKILEKEALWKGKKFRRYDILSPVPAIHGGKRHFVNQ